MWTVPLAPSQRILLCDEATATNVVDAVVHLHEGTFTGYIVWFTTYAALRCEGSGSFCTMATMTGIVQMHCLVELSARTLSQYQEAIAPETDLTI